MDTNTTARGSIKNLVFYPKIRSTKFEILNNFECSKFKFSKQKQLARPTFDAVLDFGNSNLF